MHIIWLTSTNVSKRRLVVVIVKLLLTDINEPLGIFLIDEMDSMTQYNMTGAMNALNNDVWLFWSTRKYNN